MRRINRRLASLEQDARQPRLTMEVDVTAANKTHERTEGAAAAVQAKHGDSRLAKMIQAGPTSSTSFGVKVEPPALPRRDDVSVGKGASAPTSYLSLLEMRTLTAAGGLLSTGQASTTTRITYNQPRLRFCPTDERRILRGHPFSTPSTATFFEGRTISLPPYAGGSLKPNRSKLWCSVLAVLDVICPFFGNLVRVALWGWSHFDASWWQFAAFFGGWVTWCHRLAGEVQASCLRRT